MGVSIASPSGALRISWWWEQGAGTPLRADDAHALLARVAPGEAEMLRLRRFAAEALPARVEHLDDAEVLEALAGWVAAGRVVIDELRAPALGTFGDEAEEAPAAPPPVPAAAKPEPEVAEAEPPALPGVDAETQAAVLRRAAESGTPLCEICEKAA